MCFPCARTSSANITTSMFHVANSSSANTTISSCFPFADSSSGNTNTSIFSLQIRHLQISPLLLVFLLQIRHLRKPPCADTSFAKTITSCFPRANTSLANNTTASCFPFANASSANASSANATNSCLYAQVGLKFNFVVFMVFKFVRVRYTALKEQQTTSII